MTYEKDNLIVACFVCNACFGTNVEHWGVSANGRKTILKMRRIFKIPKRVKLYATAYIYVCDLTTKKKTVPTDSIASLTVSDWLRKVYECWHKVYVYDDQLRKTIS